jgi:hypothetical protein
LAPVRPRQANKVVRLIPDARGGFTEAEVPKTLSDDDVVILDVYGSGGRMLPSDTTSLGGRSWATRQETLEVTVRKQTAGDLKGVAPWNSLRCV